MPRRPEVDAWFARYDNPMKPVVQRMREIILAVDPRVDECIKWQAPTFTFEGNLASFYPKAQKHASLMFHTGAQIPGSHPRLEGAGDVARFLKIADLVELEAARADLEAIVRAWIALKSSGTAKTKVIKKPAAKRAPAPKKKAVAAKKAAGKKPAAKKPAAKKKAAGKK